MIWNQPCENYAPYIPQPSLNYAPSLAPTVPQKFQSCAPTMLRQITKLPSLRFLPPPYYSKFKNVFNTLISVDLWPRVRAYGNSILWTKFEFRLPNFITIVHLNFMRKMWLSKELLWQFWPFDESWMLIILLACQYLISVHIKSTNFIIGLYIWTVLAGNPSFKRVSGRRITLNDHISGMVLPT